MRRGIFLILQLLIFGSSSAVTFHEVDTTRPLRCLFSIRDHNRIMIDKGRVKKIIYPENKITIRLEELSGQAFIYAVEPNPRPITLAVVTDNGLVQDIEIEFAERPVEVVILKEPEEDLQGQQEVVEVPVQQKGDCLLNHQINEILLGGIPEGYVSYPLERKKWEIKTGVQAEAIAKLKGSSDILYLYEITNCSRKRKEIVESEFERPGSRWIFLETNRLSPQEKILGIVCIGHS